MQSLYNKSKADYFFANGVNGLDISSPGPVIPWTPAEITTSLWLDAADASTITIDTGVSQWNDKSGGAKHAVQATGSRQPAYLTADQNGLNVLSFNGSSSNLTHTYANPTTNVSIFVVSSVNSQSGYRGLFTTNGGTSTQTMVLANSGDNFWGTYGTAEQRSNSNIQGQGWQILTLIRTTSGTFYRNGSTDGTFVNASGQPGHIGGELATGQLVSGKIAEIIVYNTNITDADRQLNEGYLAWKWGMVASLPANHPYKNEAPTAPAPIPTSASHTSDIVTGSNWITAGYGTEGYVLPNGESPSTATLQVIPSWLKNYSNTFNYFFSDTFNSNRPNKPDNSGTNNFGISIFGSTPFVDFDIEPDAGTRYVSFYMTIDPNAPPDGLQLLIRVINRRYNTELVPFRIYNNTTGSSGISASGGLIAKFQVSGTIRFEFFGLGFFGVGLLHGIFFD